MIEDCRRMCENCGKKMSKKKWEFLTRSPDEVSFRWYTCSFVCAMSLLEEEVSEYKHVFEGTGGTSKNG